MAYHWAKTMADAEEAACGENVGELLMGGEDVTDDKDSLATDTDACKECLAEINKLTES